MYADADDADADAADVDDDADGEDTEQSMAEMGEEEEGDIEAEVSIPESDVEALRTARDVIDQILGASDGEAEGEAGGDEEMAELPAPEAEEMPIPPAPEGEEEESDDVNEVEDDEFQKVYKGEVSKSGVPVLPSKRGRNALSSLNIEKKTSLKTPTLEESSDKTEINNTDNVTDNVKEQK